MNSSPCSGTAQTNACTNRRGQVLHSRIPEITGVWQSSTPPRVGINGNAQRLSCQALAQFLDYGFCKVIVDFAVTGNGLGLFGLLVGVPVMSATVTNKDASHIFKRLDQITSFHLRDNQFFNFSDIWHMSRFQIIQQVL